MRASDKSQQTNRLGNQLYGVNLHDFLEKYDNNSMIELASEFGLSLGDVRKLKKQLEKN
ncbi:hypothetical protein [Bacillus kwashiorkori]|uniref:hypothetical protein n=1 Tax=Bacillus kwashiorkori TaxID=1522318 RepID=UPI000783E648|nr:hypothetical protein [Bacillus kwashiorkori]